MNGLYIVQKRTKIKNGNEVEVEVEEWKMENDLR